MNVATLTMDRSEAREKAQSYRKQLRRRNDVEYEAAAEAYELMAEGKTLVDVGIAIREGGFDEQMRPKLAIARADRYQVCFRWRSSSDTGTFNCNRSQTWGRQYEGLVEQVNFNRRHGLRGEFGDGRSYQRDVEGFALVPMIPAGVRPAGNPKDWHILWEVEQWANQRIGARPPVDPYLLKRLRGDLFVILAEWDLTELERYVMSGRAKWQG